MMSLVDTGKTATFGNPDHINQFVDGEILNQDLVAGLDVARNLEAHFPQEADRNRPGLFEVAVLGLLHTLGRRAFHQAELNGIVSVFLRRLPLDHDARPGLHHRRRHDIAIRREDLGHAEFFSKNRFYHFHHPGFGVRGSEFGLTAFQHPGFPEPEFRNPNPGHFVCSLPNALISMSTPEGRSSLVSASMVAGVGSRRSIRRGAT